MNAIRSSKISGAICFYGFYGSIVALLFLAACGGAKQGALLSSTNEAAFQFANSRIVKERACTTCHTIGSSGGTVGPILNQVGNRRTPEWLNKWLHDPNTVKEGTRMPNFEFSDAEVDEVVSYLQRMKKNINSAQILTESKSLEEAGPRLFRAYDCLACHRIGGEGRFIGPDLTWVARRKSREWERIWLKDPPAYKPGTFMPNFHLSPDEIEALTAFLQSLEGQHNEESRKWEELTALILDSPRRERGALIFKRLACWSCHGEKGIGGVKNPNAAPNGEVPPLTEAANDYDAATLKRIILRGSQPEKLDPNGPEPSYSCPPWDDALTDQETNLLIAYLESIAPRRPKFRFR